MMRSMERVPSAESASLPLTGLFLVQSTVDFSAFRTSAGGFWLKHTNFLVFLSVMAALVEVTEFLIAHAEVLNFSDLLCFFANLLSGKDFIFTMRARGKI